MICYAQYDSPLGVLLLSSEDGCLTGLWMDRDPLPGWIPGPEEPVLVQARQWLDDYFAGSQPRITFPLAPGGTAFQQQVWLRLQAIPYGTGCTYGDIAREMQERTGKRMSAQAVGGAVGRNPISILIPCHRVVGQKGALTGYAWGLERKQWLLSHEGWKG